MFPAALTAQLNNEILSDKTEYTPQDTLHYGIAIESFNYLRNTEYFNNIELGRTLFGYQLNPRFFITPRKNVALEAGVWVRTDFGGRVPYTQALPTFTLKLGNNRNRAYFGTLEGALSHRLIEPLFDINSCIEKRIENGFRFLHDNEKMFFDIWINWEKFIERGSAFKEQLTTGFNATPILLQTKTGFTLRAPLQSTLFHRGGQIDSDTGNILIVVNAAAGLDANLDLKGKFIEKVRASILECVYRENSQSGYMAYKNGSGLMANLEASGKNLTCMLTYWNADRFIAPRGTNIYQSVSLDKPGFTTPHRELMFIRFLYNRQIYEHVFLSVRFEPFYDFSNRQTDYSYSVYITYRENFILGNLRKR